MKPQFIEFMNQAQSVCADPIIRSKVIATAVAVAISRTQNLPSSEVENAEGYFTGQLLPLINRQIAEFNEEVVFDVIACLSQVRQLWHLRYASAFGSGGVNCAEGASFFEAFTGVDRFIADSFKLFALENSKAIITLSQFAAGIVVCQEG